MIFDSDANGARHVVSYLILKSNELKQIAMTTKKLLFLYFVLIVLGVAAVLAFGINPKPVDKINLSEFENNQVVVSSVLHSLRQEIKNLPIFILGVDPQDPTHNEFIMKFLELSSEPGLKFDGVLFDQSLSIPKGLETEIFSIANEKERFLSGIQTALDKKIRLLVVVPNLIAASILPMGISKDLKIKYPEPIFMSLSLSNFPRNREQEPALSIPCNTGEEDLSQTSKLGCLILQKSRGLYRKKMKKDAVIGFMIQVGMTDYVLSLTKEN